MLNYKQIRKRKIEAKEDIAFGKPVIAGTRIAVDFVLGLLAEGWSIDKIIKHYPHLKKQDIFSVLDYSKDLVKEWRGYPLSSK